MNYVGLYGRVHIERAGDQEALPELDAPTGIRANKNERPKPLRWKERRGHVRYSARAVDRSLDDLFGPEPAPSYRP